MKGKELAEIAMQYPVFEFEFVFVDGFDKFPNVRGFSQLVLADVGHSDKVVLLSGDEK